MYLPWPVRPLLDYSRRQRTIWSGLQELRECSGAMGPVKYAFTRAARGPSSAERRLWSSIEKRRQELSQRTDKIDLQNGTTVHVGDHAMNSSISRPWSDILFQLVRVIQPRAALELGTCVGMSGSYIASAMRINKKGHLWTIEGIPDSAKVAQETFTTLGLADLVTPVVGMFNDKLQSVFTNGPFSFVFIDGHHDGDATIEYYRQIKPQLTSGSVMIFDDIRWSRGMQKAWQTITEDKELRDHATVFGYGIAAIY